MRLGGKDSRGVPRCAALRQLLAPQAEHGLVVVEPGVIAKQAFRGMPCGCAEASAQLRITRERKYLCGHDVDRRGLDEVTVHAVLDEV